MDLGAGDGAFLIEAARRAGCRGCGIELDAGLVATARQAAQAQGVADRVSFYAVDMFAVFGSSGSTGAVGDPLVMVSVAAVDVLYLYQLPAALRELEPHLAAWLAGGQKQQQQQHRSPPLPGGGKREERAVSSSTRTVCCVTWPLSEALAAAYLDPPDPAAHAQRGFYIYRVSSNE